MIVVIPARGGSKRIPNKNIYPLAGKPLLEYTLDLVEDAALPYPVYVSTDDQAIAAVAAKRKNVQVVHRPLELAVDNASTESTLLHVLDQIDTPSQAPQWVMTLQPTSPFRSADTIRRFIEVVFKEPEGQDCLMSFTENRGDFWVANDNGVFTRLFPNAPRRQQDRTPLYEENSAIYISKVKVLRETGSVLGMRVRGLSIPVIEGFDINTMHDMQIAEALVKDMKFSKHLV